MLFWFMHGLQVTRFAWKFGIPGLRSPPSHYWLEFWRPLRRSTLVFNVMSSNIKTSNLWNCWAGQFSLKVTQASAAWHPCIVPHSGTIIEITCKLNWKQTDFYISSHLSQFPLEFKNCFHLNQPFCFWSIFSAPICNLDTVHIVQHGA